MSIDDQDPEAGTPPADDQPREPPAARARDDGAPDPLEELLRELAGETNAGAGRADRAPSRAADAGAALAAEIGGGSDREAAAATADSHDLLEQLITEIDDEIAGQAPRIAVERTLTAATGERRRYLLFTFGGGLFAFPVERVLELARVPRITWLPNVPAWVRGVSNLRGDVLVVLDPQPFLGLEPLANHPRNRMLVVRAPAQGGVAGLLVATVQGIRTLDAATLQVAALSRDSDLGPYVDRLAEHEGRTVAILDSEKLLAALAAGAAAAA